MFVEFNRKESKVSINVNHIVHFYPAEKDRCSICLTSLRVNGASQFRTVDHTYEEVQQMIKEALR